MGCVPDVQSHLKNLCQENRPDPIFLQIDEDFVINGLDNEYPREIEDSFFFNHSCEPNAGIKGQIFLIAMRDIRKGEEVTFDYAMCLHETKEARQYRMKCRCESPNCRGLSRRMTGKSLNYSRNTTDGFHGICKRR
jgi:hypothetical protein